MIIDWLPRRRRHHIDRGGRDPVDGGGVRRVDRKNADGGAGGKGSVAAVLGLCGGDDGRQGDNGGESSYLCMAGTILLVT